MPTLKRITLSYDTTMAYLPLVQVPDDATPDDLFDIAQYLYRITGFEKFTESDDWSKAESDIDDPEEGDDSPDLVVTRDGRGWAARPTTSAQDHGLADAARRLRDKAASQEAKAGHAYPPNLEADISPSKYTADIVTTGGKQIIARCVFTDRADAPYMVDRQTAEACARLFAAGPRLVEALERLLNAPSLNVDEGLEDEDNAAMEFARSVLSEIE